MTPPFDGKTPDQIAAEDEAWATYFDMLATQAVSRVMQKKFGRTDPTISDVSVKRSIVTLLAQITQTDEKVVESAPGLKTDAESPPTRTLSSISDVVRQRRLEDETAQRIGGTGGRFINRTGAVIVGGAPGSPPQSGLAHSEDSDKAAGGQA